MAYATRADLRLFGLPPAVLDPSPDYPADPAAYPGIPEADQDNALDAGASLMDDKLTEAGVLPFTGTPPSSLRIYNAWIAAYLLLSTKGFNPEGPDRLIVDRYKQAMTALDAIGEGEDVVAIPGDPGAAGTGTGGAVYAPTGVWGSTAAVDTAGQVLVSGTGGGTTGF